MYLTLERICPSCLMKHSKVRKRRRKRQQVGEDGEEDEVVMEVDSREEFDRIAESLLESSGISDSSDEKQDSDEESLEEVLHSAPSHKLKRGSVRFEEDLSRTEQMKKQLKNIFSRNKETRKDSGCE